MKKLSLIALLIVVMSGAVYAQLDVSKEKLPQLGVADWKSPQNEATQGRFRSAADDFIRPDSYKSTGIESWFAMTSFKSIDSLNVGAGKQISELYFGAYYGGSGWGGIKDNKYTEGTTEWIDEAEKAGVIQYDGLPELGNPKNRFAILVGIANMGFRLSFFTDHQSFSGEDFEVKNYDNATPPQYIDSDFYKSYESAKGSLEPEIVWSFSKDLFPKYGIRPWAAFKMNFYRDYSKDDLYGYNSGEAKVTYDDVKIDHSLNVTVPAFNLGLGGFTIYNQNDFKFSADLEYGLVMAIYSNEYSYLDANEKYQIGTIKGLYGKPIDPKDLSKGYDEYYTENSYSKHFITPSVSGSWSGENLGLKFKLGFGLTFSSDEVMEKDLSNDTDKRRKGTLVNKGTETIKSVIGFSPKLELAAQWWIVPKLALNIGGAINIDIERTTTETEEYGVVDKVEGKKIKDSAIKTVKTEYGKPGNGNKLSLGVTLKPAEYLIFEVSSGVTFDYDAKEDKGKNNNDISVFESGEDGLLFFYSVLVSLKF
ncbi:MAG: hypothetical protein LBQ82_09660 [Treponema sp.]|jgi:hypothetical protein|nr:hypothetical protein [Treponema sp.]